MTEMQTSALLAESAEVFEIRGDKFDADRPDLIHRFDIEQDWTGPIRISAELCSEGIAGVPGRSSFVFFNIEYESGPVFWDTFLYPDTGTTPWQSMSTHSFARGKVKTVELHMRMPAKGKLRLRNLRIEGVEPWAADADVSIAVFGDSTDQTTYIPQDLRLTHRLELLLRDRFCDNLIDVHCLAEGGEFLKRLIDSGRLARELDAIRSCDIATIRFGLNDVPQNISDEDFAKQLHFTCNMIAEKYPKARIVLATTIPPKGDGYSLVTAAVAKARGLDLIELNSFLREKSAAGEADWHNKPGSFIGRSGVANPADPTGLKGDLHPNALGSQMIAECYYDYLEPIVADVIKSKS